MAKTEKEFTDLTFDELVDGATERIFDGLITGGTKEMKSQIRLYMGNVARWRWEKDRLAKGKSPTAYD